ncbi:hypothetical protein PILCRDRAFT_823472 [Piloderma croceum F 1598]|uniref:Large ribosomal subunit protein mL54 n=1 Tax=Piloderma croceum (strain F 1598) TaxID=765440 RepID=A0A0C3AZZ4_PILCF|nr:hypothetical protein PILCRDRAFT_823472 [Piloderma croceum F 1598]
MSAILRLPRPRLRTTCPPCLARGYTEKSTNKEPQPNLPKSSCPAHTLLVGLDYLKGQQPVVAFPDEDYPPWLWTLLPSRMDVNEEPGPGKVSEQQKERNGNIKQADFLIRK